jgi:oligopeptidase A
MNNPLFYTPKLPPFSQIKPEHIVPALEQVLNDNRQQIAQLVDSTKHFTWDNFVQPLNELNDRVNQIWNPISNLHSMIDSPEFRQAYNQCLPLLSAYSSELGHNKKLYNGYKAIAENGEFERLEVAQQQIIHNELRDFRLAGVDLSPEKQARYKEIQQRLSQLTTQFSENVLDATNAWKKHITQVEEIAGLPDSTRALLKQNAEQENLPGWLLTLDFPCYFSVINYADNRQLRYEMYVAYMTRASDQGPHAGQWDNTQVMKEILALRHELANLLGFNNYAEYSLSTKMADSPESVLTFLTDLAQRSRPMAQQELAELTQFVQENDGIESLEMWDVPYYSEKLRQHRYAISQETLRPYFPLPKVLTGLFEIIKRLFGMTIQPAENQEIWHTDVQFFKIIDEQNELRGYLYLDNYARKGKRGGAWAGDCLARHRTTQGLQLPVVCLGCNFTPPVGEQPSLLTHQEVTTLFHEFGHGLHHLLTTVDYAPVAGLNGVVWDAVELPSQFLENWCWQKPALDLLAAHYQTSQPLPDELFNKMRAAKNFQAGLFMLRQLEFSIFDFRLHQEYTPDIDIQKLSNDVRQQIAVLYPPDFTRFTHSFSHIFAGGYAAGYYSYKWAEVLSADAFAKFAENGIFDTATGRQFLHAILEKGGSQEPMTLFVEFRGREPKIDALLKQCGITT